MTVDNDKREPETGGDYRYKHFTTRLLFKDLRFRKNAARPRDLFPSVVLVSTSGNRLDNSKVFRNIFSPLSPDQCGIAAVLSLTLSVLIVLGLLAVWALT